MTTQNHSGISPSVFSYLPTNLESQYFSFNYYDAFYQDDTFRYPSFYEETIAYVSKTSGQISSTLDSQRNIYREILKRLTLMSDALMRNVLKNIDCTEYILKTILEKQQLKIIEQTIQKDFKNLQGRSAILDCVAQDDKGILYNIEIQQENEGASPKRARYHSGLLDMNFLMNGHDFQELPETYIIFITRNDILKQNRPIYHIQRRILEGNLPFEDEAHIIYVNSSYQDNSKLGQLMHDFHCSNASDIFSDILAERIRELKETPEGVEHMCKEMDQLFKMGEEQGEKRGEKRGILIGKQQAILRSILLISQNMKVSPDKAMELLELTPTEREMYKKNLY